MPPNVKVNTHRHTPIDVFELASSPAGTWSRLADVSFANAIPASTTVAAALSQANQLDLASPPDLDGSDHWFRTRIANVGEAPRTLMVLEGLATVADLWIDGIHVLHSENMFRRHEIDVSRQVRNDSEIVMRFSALPRGLSQRRPRLRWRTRIVEQQQLRWTRTSLIGRTPGFCPGVPVIGPYRGMSLLCQYDVSVRRASVAAFVEGTKAHVVVQFELEALGSNKPIKHADLTIEGDAGNGHARLQAVVIDNVSHFETKVPIDDVAIWWPHTHGEQPRSHVRVALEDGVMIDLGRLAFRTVRIDRGDDGRGFGFIVNGHPIFCRGACWTTDNLLTPGGDGSETLSLVRDAGMNMLRVPGIMAYENDSFYERCDELGILVWQDFMFANMDYPIDDAAFEAEVCAEARDLLARIGARPCLALLCGGSEVEQQVSMMGMPRDLWNGRLFHELLPSLTRTYSGAVPYISSSPSGGDLPFHTDVGVSHYYGVGAYLRPLEDARRSDVRFTSECLAFANVPERETIEGFMRDLDMPFHHPRWKERVPRDRGVGWDFEDVRDHYLRLLFGMDPVALRYADPQRYLALSRAVVCETIESTFSEWRRAGSRCQGGLVFWLKDLWAGAGWGVIDSLGVPKSPYFSLKRVLGPVALVATDEGLNGVVLHVVNDKGSALSGTIEVTLYRAGEVVVARAQQTIVLNARETRTISVDAMLDRFVDSAYAYRFGPPTHDLLVAQLQQGSDILACCFHHPTGRFRAQEMDLGLCANWERRGTTLGVRVKTHRFAQCISIDVDGHTPSDSYFSLEPGGQRFVTLTLRDRQAGQVRGVVTALNAMSAAAISERT